jgi:hypothetical protein
MVNRGTSPCNRWHFDCSTDRFEEIAMRAYSIRRVPWTCHWGRFGVAVEDLGLGRSKVDDVFWACHHPRRAPELRLMKRDECEHCQFWEEAARLRAEC